MMDRYLLRYFLAVVDQGNFSKAAAYCNVSQPTLSVGISKLEALVGRPLFIRSNRRIELTQAGAALASHARKIEAEFVSAERATRDAVAPAMVRLGVLSTIPASWIEDYAARLRSEHSGIRIELVEARERDLVERLTRGRIDVALTIRRDDLRFAGTTFFSEGYSLAMPVDHPLARAEVIDGSDLADNVMIVRRHCELLSDTSRYFTARGVRPFFAARTTSDDRALRLVRAGLGITVMPDCFQARGVARARLSEFAFTRDIGLLFASHCDPSSISAEPALSTLVQVIERKVADQ